MKNRLMTAAATALLIATTACAADQKPVTPSMGMMQGGMMMKCQSHMKNGKMMDSMPKDMMAECQKMMKNGMSTMSSVDGTPSAAPAADDADHTKHHPAQ